VLQTAVRGSMKWVAAGASSSRVRWCGSTRNHTGGRWRSEQGSDGEGIWGKMAVWVAGEEAGRVERVRPDKEEKNHTSFNLYSINTKSRIKSI
jgi:hypothetical protein